MLRVTRYTSGPKKGKFQLPSEVGGNTAFTEVADAITEQFEIITEGKNKAGFQKAYRMRIFSLVFFVGIAVLLLFSNTSKQVRERVKSSFNTEKYNRTEISKLDRRYQAPIKVAEDSFFSSQYENLVKENATLKKADTNMTSLRYQVMTSKTYSVYISYVSRALYSAGLTEPSVDQVKMFLEAERAHGYSDRLEELKELDRYEAKVDYFVSRKTVVEIWRIAVMVGILAISLFLVKLLGFAYHMGIRAAIQEAKRFLALEAYKLTEFNVAAIEDYDLDGLCFVQRDKNSRGQLGHITPAYSVDDSITELSSINSARYL